MNKGYTKNSLISKHMASTIQDSTLNAAYGSTSFFLHFNFELPNLTIEYSNITIDALQIFQIYKGIPDAFYILRFQGET